MLVSEDAELHVIAPSPVSAATLVALAPPDNLLL
jgi:hypothetical protein